MILQNACSVRSNFSCATARSATRFSSANRNLASIKMSATAGSTRFVGRNLSTSEVPQAQKLLYDVFIQEKHWSPGSQNPSGISVDHERKLVKDAYDASCLWYGVFDSGKLVGCCRTSTGLDAGFELEQYRPVPLEGWAKPAQEINRMAFLPEYRSNRNSVAVFHMVKAILHRMDTDGIQTIFCTPPMPHPGKMYLDLGMEKAEQHAFKNDRWDQNGEETWLLYGKRCNMRPAADRLEKICAMAARRESQAAKK